MKSNLLDDQARPTLIRSIEATSDLLPIGGSNPNFIPIPTSIYTQPANQLLNSDFSHSWNTWEDVSPSSGDDNDECAYWYSNLSPTRGQVLDPSHS